MNLVVLNNLHPHPKTDVLYFWCVYNFFFLFVFCFVGDSKHKHERKLYNIENCINMLPGHSTTSLLNPYLSHNRKNFRILENKKKLNKYKE